MLHARVKAAYEELLAAVQRALDEGDGEDDDAAADYRQLAQAASGSGGGADLRGFLATVDLDSLAALLPLPLAGDSDRPARRTEESAPASGKKGGKKKQRERERRRAAKGEEP